MMEVSDEQIPVKDPELLNNFQYQRNQNRITNRLLYLGSCKSPKELTNKLKKGMWSLIKFSQDSRKIGVKTSNGKKKK